MLHQGQTGCFGRRTVRASCCKRNIFEKPSGKWEIGILGCFGMILNWGCMEGLFWRENADLFYAFPQFPHTLDALLCAHWTAGFMARPPDIGSTTCTTTFQVSNRTISFILDRFGGFWEFFFFLWIQAKTDNLTVKVWSKTSETYIVKKNNFLFVDPLAVLREFLSAPSSTSCVHPCDFSLEHTNIDDTIREGSFAGF
jgi:hypothetical protein